MFLFTFDFVPSPLSMIGWPLHSTACRVIVQRYCLGGSSKPVFFDERAPRHYIAVPQLHWSETGEVP